MNIVVNESQKKFLIMESKSNQISERLKTCKNFAGEVIRETQKQYKLDLKFLLGWGSAIGGFMHPLNEYISGEFPHLNGQDVFLLVVGLTTLVFFNTKEVAVELYKIIEQKEIDEEFSRGLTKAKELKKTFVKFLESLNLGFHQVTNIVAYAFLIPILPLIYEMSKSGFSNASDINILIKRIIASISVGMSGIVVRDVVKKLIKRFSGS